MKCTKNVCLDCDRVIGGCDCAEAQDNIVREVCVQCKTKRAYEQMKRTQQLNAKLKELGVLYEPE